MIIVTGANGQLGRAVVEQLLTRVPAEQVGVSVRDTQKAQDLAALGVRVRQGDFDDAASLVHAFEGASQVLIVSSGQLGEMGSKHHYAAIETARKVGAQRILYTSHMGASPTSYFPPMITHAAAEQALQQSGMSFTSLRNGYYAASALFLLGNAVETGELIAPADGPVAWTAHADLAEVTAITLADGVLGGLTPPLTGSETHDLEEIAAIASELSKRTIRRIVVSDDEYRNGLIARGVPQQRADVVLGIYLASRRGEFSRTDPTLERIINRPPVTLREVMKTVLSPAV